MSTPLRIMARWNVEAQRMEMHLRATRDMEVTDRRHARVTSSTGETIHTESSRKFTEDTIRRTGRRRPAGR